MLSYIPNGTYALDCWMEQICSLVFVTLYWKYEVWASSTRDIHRKLDINQSLSWTRNQVNFFRKVCFTLNLNISHIVFRQYFHEFLRFGDSYPHTRYSKCKYLPFDGHLYRLKPAFYNTNEKIQPQATAILAHPILAVDGFHGCTIKAVNLDL